MPVGSSNRPAARPANTGTWLLYLLDSIPPHMKQMPVQIPSGRGKQILYLSIDGVLEPLGRSQVLGYLSRLSGSGLSFVLVSLERERDFNNASVRVETEELLAMHQIEWIRLPYFAGGIGEALRNIRNLTSTSRKLIQEKPIGLIHARGHLPSFVASGLSALTGVPYIFDARSYWIEEKAEEGVWFKRRALYILAKRMERRAFRSSAGIVTLTEAMAEDLRVQILNEKSDIPLVVIPTCADFEQFTRDAKAPPEMSFDLEKRLRNQFVIGMMGSINRSYLIPESLDIFQRLRKYRSDAHLLWVTRQIDVAASLLQETGIDQQCCTIVESRYQDMPSWMGVMDWGFLLLKETFAKRGSMPTKLAEMLASGVRPIHYGCNSEVADRVREAGSGITLTDLSPLSLDAAAKHIANFSGDSASLDYARQVAAEWFSMESGARKYESLLRHVLYPDQADAVEIPASIGVKDARPAKPRSHL